MTISMNMFSDVVIYSRRDVSVIDVHRPTSYETILNIVDTCKDSKPNKPPGYGPAKDASAKTTGLL